MDFHNRWARALLALPFPIALAGLVTTFLGTKCYWLSFAAAEALGILIYMLWLRVFKLDPIHYSKTFKFQQPWQKMYFWPDPFRIRQGCTAIATALCISVLAFFFSGGFMSALFGAALGAWAYEGVRIFQNVYYAKSVA